MWRLQAGKQPVQGWTLALARSPRRVSKVSGECKSQITRPFGECDFSLPRNWLNCKINDVFYILFCREISKHKLTIVHICMAKFYTPNCPKKWASENLSGRVHFEGYSPEWRVLSKLSVQPWSFECKTLTILTLKCTCHA